MTNSTTTMKQTPYEGVLACNEGHLACVLALDVSGSMQGSKLQAVIDGVERFKKANSADPLTLKRVDVSVITFGGSKVEVIQDWIPLANFIEQPPLQLTAGGQTPMAQAITTSLSLVRERNRLYATLGTPAFTPMVMLLTDGRPTSTEEEMAEAKRQLREREDRKKVRLFACGVGIEESDMDILASLSKRVIQCTSEESLSGLFDWMSESIATISHSRAVTDGDSAQLPPLPQGLSVVPSDW